MRTFGHYEDSPPGGRRRAEWASPKRVGQRKRVPLSLWMKNRPLLSSFRTKAKGRVAVVPMSPDGRDSVFGGYFDRVGIRQSRDGSVSQRARAPEGREKFLDFALYRRRSAAG